ncbi:uncharacterized protein BYT42DRAFT_484410, partial [Radiomyces spectabilis]|uniref:uncharacterized protein n=1 Tax=Radiomyces spectabilis TaxID=64574 RepID=UPI00221FEE5F
ERLKEEIWDLELNKQELSQQLSDLQEEQEKTLADQARMTRHQTELLRELEYMKSQQTQWSQTLESLQQNHQEEISHVRKSLCHLQDENESLSKRLSQMLESEKLQLDSQPSSPRQCSLMKQPSVEVQSLEIEQLKASLSEATYRLETMQRQLEDEREERMEIHKLLQEAQDQIQHFRQSSLWSPSS